MCFTAACARYRHLSSSRLSSYSAVSSVDNTTQGRRPRLFSLYVDTLTTLVAGSADQLLSAQAEGPRQSEGQGVREDTGGGEEGAELQNRSKDTRLQLSE